MARASLERNVVTLALEPLSETPKEGAPSGTSDTFERETERTDVMSVEDVMAMDAVGRGDTPIEGRSVAREFSLGGSVPRAEPKQRGGFKSEDVFLRLENKVYGPLTQDELGELLQSGQLTGFESASSDLRTWTPLIYHPRMTLSGQIDPDATHALLHGRSDLPAAGSRPVGINLEDLADLADDEDIPVEEPGAPLAAILIKPVAARRGADGAPVIIDAPVYADLEEESLEEVIERSGIPPIPEDALHARRISGEHDHLTLTDDPVALPTPPAIPSGAPDAAPEGFGEAFEAPQGVDSTLALSPVEALGALNKLEAEAPRAPSVSGEHRSFGDRMSDSGQQRAQRADDAGLPREFAVENSELMFFTSENDAVERAIEEVEIKEERVGPSTTQIYLAIAVLIIVGLASVVFLTDVFTTGG